MVELEEIVAPIIVLDDDFDTEMCESGLKLHNNHDKGFNTKKNEDGKESAAPTSGKKSLQEGTVVESTVGCDNGLDYGFGDQERDKNNVGNVSSVTNGGGSVVKVNGYGSLDCFSGSDKNITDGFHVGDIVWCKLQNYPWSPGQVYDIKDASEYALKYSLEGRTLVAFFGDGSCSWVLQSQLIPFVENFVKMSTLCDSKSFQNAVQEAVDEISRIKESEKVCRCIPEAERGDLARPVAKNAGVKAGVLVPEVDVHRLSVPEYEPYQVLEKVMHFAKAVLVGSSSTLDLAVLKSWLSAFNRFKGGHQLPSYNEPTYIDGLEEENEITNEIEDDLNLPIKFLVSLPVVGTGKSKASSNDVVYHKNKWKTIVELLGKTTKVESECQGTRSVEKKCKKRKAEDFENVLHEETNGVGVVDGVITDSLSREQMETEISAGENVSSEGKELLDYVFTPRERKKSKYLSPPYTNLFGRIRSSSSLFKSISKCVGKASEENLPSGQLEIHNTSVNTKLPYHVSDVEMPVDEFLSEIQLAAVNPLCLSNEGSSDMVLAFVSALRRSTYMQNNFMLDARAVTRKLEIMRIILEKYQTKFSMQEKSSLKEDMKQLMKKVESVNEKVVTASEKVKMAED